MYDVKRNFGEKQRKIKYKVSADTCQTLKDKKDHSYKNFQNHIYNAKNLYFAKVSKRNQIS